MRFIQLFLLTLLFVSAKGQTYDSYKNDLLLLKSSLQKTPSFKDQIQGQKLIEYNLLFENLKNDSSYKISPFRYFKNLSQLFFPIKDNHLGFYQIARFSEQNNLETFLGNIDSLKSSLATKNIDSIEGIYHQGQINVIGIFRKSINEFVGVVLDTKSKTLTKGDIVLYLFQTNTNQFKAIYTYGTTNYFILYQNEKFLNKSLINGGLTKNVTDFIPNNKAIKSTDFELVNITNDIQYLRIKHFDPEKKKMEQSEQFYNSIKDSLNAPNLILDLSINYGGGEKVSKKYLKLLKKYTKTNKLFVLVGNSTISHGEIFTLQLKGLKNVIILGQTTQGTLTYGINTDKSFLFGNNKIRAIFTDMDGNNNLLQYESIGVNPDKYLLMDKDWIEQVIEMIRKQ
jgi:hypothetical protein